MIETMTVHLKLEEKQNRTFVQKIPAPQKGEKKTFNDIRLPFVKPVHTLPFPLHSPQQSFHGLHVSANDAPVVLISTPHPTLFDDARQRIRKHREYDRRSSRELSSSTAGGIASQITIPIPINAEQRSWIPIVQNCQTSSIENVYLFFVFLFNVNCPS